MNQHVYSEREAQRILDAFPHDKLNDLVKLAERAKEDGRVIENYKEIVLPEGWAYGLYTNCIIARYQDGEQERKEFFLPQIWIEFLDADTIVAKKSVETRLALGFCSCGKPMPVIQGLLWANDMIEQKGILATHSRIAGYATALFFALWIRVRPIHQYSLAFNRHPHCL